MPKVEVVYVHYEREGACICPDPHAAHPGFNWQEGSGSTHYPHRITRRELIEVAQRSANRSQLL